MALKPGININVLDETCETRLLYLRDSLFSELHQKNITALPPPLNSDDVHCARILHCDNQVPEMYIEHVQCTDLNQHNVEVLVNLQTNISPMDRTIFLQEKPTLFDVNYVPPHDDVPTGSSTGNSKGSSKDATWPSVSIQAHHLDTYTTLTPLNEQIKQESDIKTEPAETATTILAEHSPHCQLRLEISKVFSIQQPNRTPTPTDGYSTDSTIQGGIVTPPAYHLDSTSSSGHPSGSKDVTLQEVTSTSETTSTQLLSYPDYSSHYAEITPHPEADMDDQSKGSSKDATWPSVSIQAHHLDTYTTLTPPPEPSPRLVTSSSPQEVTPSNSSESNLVYQAGYYDETSAINITPVDKSYDSEQHSTSAMIPCSQDVTVAEHTDDTIDPASQDVITHNRITMGMEIHKQVTDDNDTMSPQVVTDQSTGSVVRETSGYTIPSSQEVTTSGSVQEVIVNEINIHNVYPVNTDSIVWKSNSTGSTSSVVTNTTNQEGNSPKLCPTSTTENGERPAPAKTTSQEVTNTPDTVLQDVTTGTPIDPQIQKRKEHLRSLGLSDSVYSNNSETFYPVLTPEQDEVDYISFKDIIDTAWSLPLENLSANDIELEQAYLKSCRTSSPKPVSTTAGSSSSSTIMLDLPLDSEKDDPTYG